MATGNAAKATKDRAAEEAKREQRRLMITQALLQGLNYRDIAELPDIDCSISTISRDVNLLLDRWRRENVKDLDRWLTLALRRMDMLINAHWNKANNGDPQATQTIMALLTKQAEFLGINFVDLSYETGRHTVSEKASMDPDSVEAWMARDQQTQLEIQGLVDDFTDPDTELVIGVADITIETVEAP